MVTILTGVALVDSVIDIKTAVIAVRDAIIASLAIIVLSGAKIDKLESVGTGITLLIILSIQSTLGTTVLGQCACWVARNADTSFASGSVEFETNGTLGTGSNNLTTNSLPCATSASSISFSARYTRCVNQNVTKSASLTLITSLIKVAGKATFADVGARGAGIGSTSRFVGKFEVDIALSASFGVGASFTSVHGLRARCASVGSSTTIFKEETKFAGNAGIDGRAVKAIIDHAGGADIREGTFGRVIEVKSSNAVGTDSGGRTGLTVLHGGRAKGAGILLRSSDLSQEGNGLTKGTGDAISASVAVRHDGGTVNAVSSNSGGITIASGVIVKSSAADRAGLASVAIGGVDVETNFAHGTTVGVTGIAVGGTWGADTVLDKVLTTSNRFVSRASASFSTNDTGLVLSKESSGRASHALKMVVFEASKTGGGFTIYQTTGSANVVDVLTVTFLAVGTGENRSSGTDILGVAVVVIHTGFASLSILTVGSGASSSGFVKTISAVVGGSSVSAGGANTVGVNGTSGSFECSSATVSDTSRALLRVGGSRSRAASRGGRLVEAFVASPGSSSVRAELAGGGRETIVNEIAKGALGALGVIGGSASKRAGTVGDGTASSANGNSGGGVDVASSSARELIPARELVLGGRAGNREESSSLSDGLDVHAGVITDGQREVGETVLRDTEYNGGTNRLGGHERNWDNSQDANNEDESGRLSLTDCDKEEAGEEGEQDVLNSRGTRRGSISVETPLVGVIVPVDVKLSAVDDIVCDQYVVFGVRDNRSRESAGSNVV